MEIAHQMGIHEFQVLVHLGHDSRESLREARLLGENLQMFSSPNLIRQEVIPATDRLKETG